MVKLSIAKCCGACMHVNKPKKPQDHAAHYEVAKTERWCYKYNIPTVREAVCEEGFELAAGRCAAKTNLGRANKQNERLQRILAIRDWMVEHNIDKIPYYNKYRPGRGAAGHYHINNGTLKRYWISAWKEHECYVSVKDESQVRDLEEAFKNFKKEMV